MTPKLLRRSAEGDKKYLLPFSDLHIGARNCNLQKAKDYLTWAIKNDAWVVCMGDMIENGTRNSVGSGVYDQTMNPQEQQNAVEELLQPVAEKGLLLGMLQGNHEERTMKDSGIDITQNLCKILKVPYLGYSIFLYLRVGKITYTIYATHGGSTSTTLGGKVQSIYRLSQHIEADLYLQGHVHDMWTGADVVRYVDRTTKTATEKKRYYAITGSYLGYQDGYGEMKGYPPVKLGSPRVRLNGERHDVHISI